MNFDVLTIQEIFDDENLYEIINLFETYLNGGKTK